MKKKVFTSIVTSILLILLLGFSVNAEKANVSDVGRLGNTSMNAINYSRLAYENGAIYTSIERNNNYALYKHTPDSGVTEKITDNNIYGLNILDGVIYGYINYADDEEKKSGIYKIDTNNDNKQTLIYQIEDVYNLLVVEDIIYFLNDNEYGDTSFCSVKVDGSDVSIIDKQIISFTVYKDEVYILSDDGLQKMIITDDKITYTDISKNLDTKYNSKFTIMNDYIYIMANGYKDNKQAGIYKISLDKGNKVELIKNTVEAYEFDVSKDYIIYLNSYDEVVRVSLDGKEKVKIFQAYEVIQLSNYEESIYLLTYENIDDIFGDQLWRIDLDGSNENMIYPELDKDYNKIKDILTKTTRVMNNLKRYDMKVSIVDDRKDEEVVNTYKLDYSIDQGNKIISEKYNLKSKSEDNKPDNYYYNEWADDKRIYVSRDNSPWRFLQHTELNESTDNDLFNIYNFIDNGCDLSSKLKLTEDSKQYILQGKNSFSRQFNKIKDNYWLQFLTSDFYDLDTFNYCIYINKTNYKIEKVVIEHKDYDIDNKVTREFRLESVNKFNLTDKLVIPNSVFKSLKKLQQATTYLEKAKKANEAEKYEQAIKYSDIALKLHSKAIHAYGQKAYAFYKQGKQDEALEQLEMFLEQCLNEDCNGVYFLLAEIYSEQGDYESASKCIYRINWSTLDSEKDLDKYISCLLIASKTFIGLKNNDQALSYVNEALLLDENNNLAKSHKMAILLNDTKYDELLDYTNEQLENEDLQNQRYIYYYKGKTNLMLDNRDEAIKAYKKALRCKEEIIDNSALYFDMGLYYTIIGKYNIARIYSNKIDKEYNIYKVILDMAIEESEKPISVKVGEFVLNNYLYLNNTDVASLTKQFMKNDNATLDDINDYIESIKQDDDKFTFFYKVEKNEEGESEEEVTYKQIDGSTEYIKVSSFLNQTSSKFINYIEGIEKPYNKTLIIDLRGNGGGLISAATEMLDVLLPDCSPCYLIDRDGKTSNIESDYYRVPFKSINILVDNDSASASELLALGLKKFLGNVQILGKTTYGKGVGQQIYVDNNGEFVLYLVSFYWNILEENINDVGITPDVIVEGTELEDFLKVIKDKQN
ncbi:S41 family peptidase [Vallitalea sp.]|jgi:tetratricopeptide (TPR) repeat protein|uniref:S41 family peptidase n=1 Tax=Vallitalea sp. TaxID=1882829 RepID=UPI0025F7EDA3|nr:S41 family peptidase [Vallitalea sp.]MCT4687833.1 S41 family peptidase [Vallitalea sp.]